MVDNMRRPGWAAVCLTMAVLLLGAGAATETLSGAANAQEPASPRRSEKPDVSALFGQRGEDPPRPFVPMHASTVEDRQEAEAVRLYAAARACEDRGAYDEAVGLLQQALKLDPESLAILRRLTRIYVGALGKPELALESGKKVLEAAPDDTDTLIRLVEFYGRKGDTASIESLLKSTLASPKLAPDSPTRLIMHNELGKLYALRLNQLDKAAHEFGEVVKGLDEKAANRLSPIELARILTNEPATAYLGFGTVLLAANQNDLAIRAFERGLVYDDENPQIPLLLAETLLKQGKGAQALTLVDRYIKRQPQALEAYDLLTKVLTSLKREAEITPRLEEAARRDSKNVPLQYVLADRYREIGQVDKAEALYQSLLKTQPTPQIYRALAASLLKRHKVPDLLKVMCEAIPRPNGLEAISAQLQAVASDDKLALEMLDEGIKQIEAKPPTLPQRPAILVLGIIANPERGIDKAARLERLVKIQRIILAQNPSPLLYREIADTLHRLDRNSEAAETLKTMFDKFPAEKNGRSLGQLAEMQRAAGQSQAALTTARAAAQAEPNDLDVQTVLAEVLSEAGKLDESLDILRKVVKVDLDNPKYVFTLGNILTKFGRNEEAIGVFHDMLKRFPSNDVVVRIAHSNLSIIYVNQGDYAKGEAELEILYQKTPDDAGVNNDLGYLYAEQGKNLDKAESMIRKAVQEEPDNSAYLDSLGWVLFKRGKAGEALEPMTKAVEIQKAKEKSGLAPPDATIREHLGDVFLRLNQVEKAAEVWRDAETIANKAIPPDKRLPEIRKKLASLKQLGSAPKASSTHTP
ncbi:tetratricopeptide repeat protein [Aquisphaera insulae]|uniref:tetratricopeptide repeat protein n=1 Tax=Aquisphaera insulae TaxID=2712864 RepID=UPI0013ED7868|nr:tetratricopeptide repeat protein [Aquisphaera insulae]